MPTFRSSGNSFGYDDVGSGHPVTLQHGLGADRGQPASIFPKVSGWRRITLECRGHGETDVAVVKGGVGIGVFADDLIALLDALNIERSVMGGISMGAAIAVNIAVRFPQRVSALILVRPAWLTKAAPDNMAVFGIVARLIRTLGPSDGRREFERSAEFKAIKQVSPDNAGSLLDQFSHPRALERASILEDIAADGPGATPKLLSTLQIPALVIGTDRDAIHPIAYAERLAALIPGASLVEATSKSSDPDRYVDDVRHAISAFLGKLAP